MRDDRGSGEAPPAEGDVESASSSSVGPVDAGSERASSPSDETPSEPNSPAPRPSLLRLLVAPLIIVAFLLFSSGGPLGSGTHPGSPTPGPFASPDRSGGPAPSGDGGPPGSVGPTPAPAPSATPTAPPTAPPPVGDYLLMDRATLESLPTFGPAWDALKATADEPLGSARLRDQDARHGVRTLAVALVYARTGDPVYREKAREAVMDAIGSERERAGNSILALGRQLGSYVLAADLIGLDGEDDREFREWLDDIRTRELGGHGRWRTLTGTHEDSANNWGAFAGASRIAASLYLGDTDDVWAAAAVLRGFLGDADAYAGFQPVDDSADWACDPPHYVPVNPPCERDGINLDGAIVRDISRGGGLEWPPGDDGVRYTLESLQGLVVQAELLRRNGYGDPWTWSDEALRRAAGIVTRSSASGGDGWNRSEVTVHLSWLFNARYDLGIPTEPAGFGRVFGYTDWLYGST